MKNIVTAAIAASVALCLTGCDSLSKLGQSPEKLCTSDETAKNLADIIYDNNWAQSTIVTDLKQGSSFAMSGVTLEKFDKETGKASCSGVISVQMSSSFTSKYHLDDASVSSDRVTFSVQPTLDHQSLHYQIDNPDDCCKALLSPLMGLWIKAMMEDQQKQTDQANADMQAERARAQSSSEAQSSVIQQDTSAAQGD